MNELERKTEALLFYKGDEMSFKEISDILKISEEDVKKNVENLKNKYTDSGIKIIITENSAVLVTGDEVSEIIESLEKEEYEKELTKAALETLTIILYRGPIKRSMIDYIRGVNSVTTVRNLLIRGLIEKIPDSKDERSFLYIPTSDLLRFMNISDIKELQEYTDINQKIDAFIKNSKESNE